MKPPRRNLRHAMIHVALLTVFMAASVVPALRSTNCGGNPAALWCVDRCSLIVRMAAAGSPDHRFHLSDVTAEERHELEDIAYTPPEIRNVRFLVSSARDPDQGSGPRRVIVVCDRPFRNVPRRLIGLAPPTHAAAFSDGSTGLISVGEFAALDRSTFVPLNECLAGSNP